MRKSSLNNGGDPIFIIKIEHYITLGLFVMTLTDHFYCRRDSIVNFNFDKLSKKAAALILKKQLAHSGRTGDYGNNFFEGCENNEGYVYNKIYDDAKNWVVKNYPYLKKA